MASNDIIEKQGKEFDALDALIKAYRNMPPIVDDDYPEMRHYFEGRIYEYIEAMIANGRFDPQSRGELILKRGNIIVAPMHGISKTAFDDLREANIIRQREWDPLDRISTAYRGNEFGGEAGEALEEAIAYLLNLIRLSKSAGKLQNLVKKLEREKLGIPGSRTSADDLAKELADVIICTDLIAMDADVDLWKAVRDKFNATSEKVGLKTKIP